MSATDPLATVWDALERGGYAPYGKPYDFRARCPAHGGENASSLHVCAGVDFRVVVHCFARGCSVDEITAALGLTVSDLFPAGHRKAQRREFQAARRSEFDGNARSAANALLALDQLGEPWRIELTADCPYCHSPHAQLVISSNPKHRPFVHCQGACTASMFTQALAGCLEDRKEAA